MALSRDLSTRFFAIAITFGLAWTLGAGHTWTGLVISLGLTHYFLSFYFAAARMRELVTNPVLALPLFSLALFLAVVYFLRFPLEIYFGIHHAFNEGYLRRYQHRDNGPPALQIPAFRSLFHLAAYLCILRHDAQISQLPESLLWITLVVSGVLYTWQLLMTNRGQQGIKRLSGSAVEWLMLAAVVFSVFVKVTFLQMVMYHFVLWTIVPVSVMRAAGSHKLTEYALLSVGVLGMFAALTITQLGANMVPATTLYAQFYLWSYVHITASFALSSAHPDWIVRMFPRQSQQQNSRLASD